MRGERQIHDPRAETERWWNDVLAGEPGAHHPIHGDALKVKLTDGRLELSGEVPSNRDRDQLLREARARIGSGLHQLDVSRLKVKPKNEKPGILAQTLVAAYDHRDTADLALQFVLEHSRSKPLRAAVIDQESKLTNILPAEVIDAAKKQLDHGRALVAVEVDETEAFRTRALLEEDTRSLWAIAAPPQLMKAGKH